MRARSGRMKTSNLGAIVKLRVGHFALSRFLVLGCYLPVRDIFRKILGVRFYIADLEGLLELVDGGGLIVVPSAPVMTRLADDPAHREALEGADFAITDSAYMVVLWLLRTGERIKRISGLRLLRGLFGREGYKGRGETFWVMPSAADSKANLNWLRSQGFGVSAEDSYVAPLYPRQGPILDEALLLQVSAHRPRLIVIALSGGVQEKLGWYLRNRLGYRPTILCIGGAIAFLSGQQTRIPVWADRLALGWLIRFIAAPRAFAAKLKGVQRLAPMIWKYGSRRVA
jgi:N-acetylglucosaminyldiphosphoundecaprenol N-acetyl-beta-D-mannosaminyltransferase